MKPVFIKPARPGLVIRDPQSGLPLPPDGKAVVPDAFWRRRLADGDVVETKPPKPAAKGREA